MRRIKVLNLIDSLYAGGAESLLARFALEARKHENFRIDILTLYRRGFFEEELKVKGISVSCLNLSFKYDFSKIFLLRRILEEGEYDLLHVHLFPADIFSAIASLLVKKPRLIFSEHSVYNRRRSIKLYKFIDRFVYSRYCKIVCVSDLVKAELDRYLPQVASKSVVIKNAVEVQDFPDTLNKSYDIIFVGRLEKAKGVDVLLRAIQLLEKNRSLNLKVAIVGDGSQRDYLKNMVRDLEIKSKVEFLGVREDVSELMRSSKIFVLPSRWEGLPMVILEAMANKVPIIASAVGGIPEVISDGIHGLLIEPDNWDVLASRIELLLNDASLRKKLSENAFERVLSDYSIKEYCKNMLKLYEEVLKS